MDKVKIYASEFKPKDKDFLAYIEILLEERDQYWIDKITELAEEYLEVGKIHEYEVIMQLIDKVD